VVHRQRAGDENMMWLIAALTRKARSVMPVSPRRSGRALLTWDVVMGSMLPDHGGLVVLHWKRLPPAPAVYR
jgi:hypothetical protein